MTDPHSTDPAPHGPVAARHRRIGPGRTSPERHVSVVIVGAGFAGLGTAIRLLQEGYRDLLILERADEVGGTWRDNAYPGCACDVPSRLYSFSFAPNPTWSRRFAPQEEIEQYLKRCVDGYDLTPRLRLGCELQRATWAPGRLRWDLRTSTGPLTSPQAHLGTTVAGFPNLFLMAGPNTGVGHTSLIYMIESQINHLISCMRMMRDRGLGTVEVRAEAQHAHNTELQNRMAPTVWAAGGCSGWYQDRTGRITTIWPAPTWRFRHRTRAIAPKEYVLTASPHTPKRHISDKSGRAGADEVQLRS
ncbi:FAD-dependent oxidoreductase [Streptomyces sp. NPDC002785]|uniref:flavin-containing monooxygenase n=1 Tax=Streptomyces sp. NPDC002785 TaxID=3154543 RepID=UPI00331A9445